MTLPPPQGQSPAIARTSVGVKSGGLTRVMSFVHAGVLLLSEFQNLFRSFGIVLLQIVIDDQLELLHIEEEVVVAMEHVLVPLHASALCITV